MCPMRINGENFRKLKLLEKHPWRKNWRNNEGDREEEIVCGKRNDIQKGRAKNKDRERVKKRERGVKKERGSAVYIFVSVKRCAGRL